MSIIEQPKSPEIAENIPRVSRPSIGLFDAIALIFGLVIGAGIFETPVVEM